MNEDKKCNQWVGDIALSLNIIAFLPQLYHVYKKKNTKSLSWIWLITSIIANAMWIYAGYEQDVSHLIQIGAFFTSAYVILAFMKLNYD